MPYFIYRVEESAIALVKNLELMGQAERFKEAKIKARDFRSNQPDMPPENIKVIFADSPLEAEEMLLEKREKPILMEHEK